MQRERVKNLNGLKAEWINRRIRGQKYGLGGQGRFTECSKEEATASVAHGNISEDLWKQIYIFFLVLWNVKLFLIEKWDRVEGRRYENKWRNKEI